MTRKVIYLIFILIVTLTLPACSNTGKEQGSTSTGGLDSSSDGSVNRQVPKELQLMLGTVLLEESEFAVDSEQASELLTYWKVLRSLTGSERAAQAEVDAVISSIQETMTSEQMAAIEAMELTIADVTVVFETLGIEPEFAGRFGEMDPEMQATIEAMRESGEGPPEGFGRGQGLGGGMIPGGGRSGGGQGFGGDTGMSPEMIETAMAERGGALGRGFGINTRLLDAVIAFLEAKLQ